MTLTVGGFRMHADLSAKRKQVSSASGNMFTLCCIMNLWCYTRSVK